MNIADIINGVFECGGGFAILLSVRRLHRDKQVKGVHPLPVLFFTTWGLWNLFYYPSLGQWMSFAGGLFIVIVNAIWLAQIAYYSRREVTN